MVLPNSERNNSADDLVSSCFVAKSAMTSAPVRLVLVRTSTDLLRVPRDSAVPPAVVVTFSSAGAVSVSDVVFESL